MTALLGSGRAESAVLLLEKASAAEHSPWDMADRIATLRLHLGEPARARSAWESAGAEPKPGLREARVGMTYLAENDFEAARQHYGLALEAQPDLFEALYGLAVLEQDAGDAAAAFAMAKKAVTSAPNEASRTAARLIVSSVARFARPVVELAGENKRREPSPRARDQTQQWRPGSCNFGRLLSGSTRTTLGLGCRLLLAWRGLFSILRATI